MKTKETQSSRSLKRMVSPLPCPHCGGSAGLRYYTHDTRRCYYACDDIRCHFTYLDPLEALEAWNRRANNRICDK